MQVKEAMQKNVIKIKKGTTLREVARILAEKQISGAPVVDEKDRVIGIISEKGIFKTLYPDYGQYYTDLGLRTEPEKIKERTKEVSQKKVEEVMTPYVVTISPDMSLIQAGATLLARSIHRLVVVDENKKIVGIITRKDIYKKIFKEEFGI